MVTETNKPRRYKKGEVQYTWFAKKEDARREGGRPVYKP